MSPQKKLNLFALLALITVSLLSGVTCCAQSAFPETPVNKPFIIEEEQFMQEHYTLASSSARYFLQHEENTINTFSATDADRSRYHIALAGLKTNTQGCTDTAKTFLDNTQNTVYKHRMAFALAQYYFLHDQLTDALSFYEHVGMDDLSNTEIGDEKFEMAYCYFINKQFNKAEPLFASMKELKEGKYYKAGNYYYGLLAYNQNNYQQALQSFEKIQDDIDYKYVVPYYVAEIYYFMGQRTKALEKAEACMKDKSKDYYDKELHLLAAQCLFEDEHLAQAIPYFEYFYDHTENINKEDLYKMAYCYYRLENWQKAIDKFKQLNSTDDSLGQSSMYILGDCYLKTKDKQGARNAFGLCAEMTYNPGQQEASMILYAKISYEMGYNDEAMRALKKLLETFAATKYKDEANTLMSDLLIKTNNYGEALRRLEHVHNYTNEYWLSYQKANFGYAIQQFRIGNNVIAYNYLTRSMKHVVDEDYESAAYFWKGELAYRMHHYSDVITYSQNFISIKSNRENVARISPFATVQHAYLNMGYASMETQNYSSAQTCFYRSHRSKGNDHYAENVARIREADAVFMQKDYSKALTLYDNIGSSDTANEDYALFQKSIILGLQKKTNEKVRTLLIIINKMPPSQYANEARYEIALTYIEDDKYALALQYLTVLTDSVSDKGIAPKALMKTGFIYQQQNNTEKAIAAYKDVVSGYPASDERPHALDALKNIYIQQGMPGAYSQMLKDYNLPDADSRSLDSAYYAAAEAQYSNGKPDKAKGSFDNYISNYPNGLFLIKAYYYRAECSYQLRSLDSALADYEKVLQYPWSDFSDNSAKRVAKILFDKNEDDSAYRYYSMLRYNTNITGSIEPAMDGMMKSGFNTGKFSESGTYADTLLSMPGITEETRNDALLYKARQLQHYSKNDSAIVIYKQLSTNKNGEIAAEARYRIAETLLGQDSLKDAEDAANETIKLSGGYDHWIVRSYLLLADVLIREKDYFNAGATLESIQKHTNIPELKEEATKKLEAVKTLEKMQSKLKEE